VGASMHHVAAVRGAIEFGLDVIHPLMNVQGLGIVDGSREEMEEAVCAAHETGIGVFAMKPLGGGNLFRKAGECLDYIFAHEYIDSIAIGMQSIEEVDANAEYIDTGKLTPLDAKGRKLHIEGWCEGCGKCAARCGQKALSIAGERAVCSAERCILCGYCAAVCDMWAIKVV